MNVFDENSDIDQNGGLCKWTAIIFPDLGGDVHLLTISNHFLMPSLGSELAGSSPFILPPSGAEAA
ncbi:hypothetical protein GF325_02380 [Candidatus Bathyarchaeota archaeon]|nr:hypothetical protein [Candidatus Bathyarchaeota archaeon]